MAIRNRKLFPSLTYTNETTYCPDFCDPATCPYDCPTFLPYLPPPPPPPPPVPPSPTSGAAHVSPSFITASAVLVGFFILLGYYIIIAKSCFRRDQPRPDPSDGGETEYLDGNRVDHPIWLISTVGLQQSIINAISICRYRKGEGLIEGTECSVCLNEFREEESLRLLPKCSHAFHIRCIDTWLGSHTNCPLCRANIVTPNDVGFGVITVDSATTQEDSRLSTEILQVEDNQNRGERETEILQELELVNGDSGTKEMSVGDQKETEQGIGVDFNSSSEGIEETEDCRKQRVNVVGKGVVFTEKDTVGVERSQSCNGGFFLSRHSRSTSSILP